ncbi:TIGR00366 family protein [Rhodoplanes sp. TEM]|uniref:TIGR00366 family protein n=1 Tax=Rhodoplanes tepidamans TaxID=200616 RepID=A0ABT5JDL2_RHOTP|nr:MULTISPECIES: TIGR00366 family protein [Rhodoplanes]MDC7787612.1 TIGR00366 family protein [Rhodoplanes tepidamans]MDC7988032.1 TIGR00366 family protein [Rhodoplanes sp. TEM]MDQ0358040.1 short-chain fatty acids transporter [Rhodoplanes tepidamans]
MLWRLSKSFQFAADRYIPDSFVFCVILTLLAYVCGLMVSPDKPMGLVIGWYNGLWSMIGFAFQMSFMVVCCGAAAKAPLIERGLAAVARLPRAPWVGMVVLLVFGFVSSLINWAFSTILTPILAMQLSRNVKGMHFPLMIAAGYATMVIGQTWGPSASVYALVATKGHFLESSIGVWTQDQTVYNPVNTTIFFIMVVTVILIGVFTRPPAEEVIAFAPKVDPVPVVEVEEEAGERTFADRMNESRILMLIIGVAGIAVIVDSIVTKGVMKSLDFNFVIFLFLTLNAFLYNTPRRFVAAFKDMMRPAAEVMLQFPFYGGIMGMMTASGLGKVLAGLLIQVATVDTIYLWSFLSACFINLFIPSQGGQWIVQGPILTEAALALKANMPLVFNAFVHGDEATNMIQPLYVIPALALVGMKLKEVWGFMAFIGVFWIVIVGTCFLVLPRLMM